MIEWNIFHSLLGLFSLMGIVYLYAQKETIIYRQLPAPTMEVHRIDFDSVKFQCVMKLDTSMKYIHDGEVFKRYRKGMEHQLRHKLAKDLASQVVIEYHRPPESYHEEIIGSIIVAKRR